MKFIKRRQYSPTLSIDNIVSRLTISYNDLQHHQFLSDQLVKTDLQYMFHLIGDLHLPLTVVVVLTEVVTFLAGFYDFSEPNINLY